MVFAFIIPVVAFQVDRDLGREIAAHWMPEGPAVVAVTFFGWFYAGLTILLALLVRRSIRWRKGEKSKPNEAS